MPNNQEGQQEVIAEPASPISDPVIEPDNAQSQGLDQDHGDQEYATWDQIKAYVESQGYKLVAGQQSAATATTDTPSNQAGVPASAPTAAPAPNQPQPNLIGLMRERANQQYREDMRNALDDEDRAEAMIKYQDAMAAINGRLLAQQQAMTQMPIVEQQFKEANLPPEAAHHYVQFLLESENPYDEATRLVCMQRAVGMAAIASRKAPDPSNVRLPGGDAPAGAAGALPDTDPEVEAALRRTFPGLVLTPEVRRDFRARGIL